MRYRFAKDDISISRNKYGDITLSVILNGKYVHSTFNGYSEREAIKLFQQEFGTYPDNYKPIGVLTLCNFGGIAIMEFDKGIETYAYVADNYGDGYKNITKNLIKYTAKGSPYFIRNKRRYYLSEFIRA